MKPLRPFAILALSLSLVAQTKPSSKPVTHHAAASPEAVHRSAIVIDTHADTPQRMLDDHYDLTDPLNGGYLNFESAKQGNLGAEFFSIWVEPKLNEGHVRAPHAGAHRHGPPAGRRAPRQDDDGLLARGHRACPSRAQACRAHGHRRRPLHRGFHPPPAGLLPTRRPLHDAHLVQLQRLGRFLRRRGRSEREAHPGRPVGLRQRRRLRDEPPRHDGRHLPRLRQDLLSRRHYLARARLRLALRGARPHPTSLAT